MDNISLLKLKDEHFKNINGSIKENLKINNIQSYCPIMSNYFEYYNNSYSYKYFVFKSKYSINKLNEEIPFEKFDSYIKFIGYSFSQGSSVGIWIPFKIFRHLAIFVNCSWTWAESRLISRQLYFNHFSLKYT